jgi:phosphopantothenoylcysteine decarboxylase/phosphopantothenate--cysteine ligase
MNVRMWQHPATQENLRLLQARGVLTVGPNEGAMACNEFGFGRMAEPEEIEAAIVAALAPQLRPLSGRRALITSGPTREPIDPVRYISNHSSGKQGHAIAGALARLGAETTLVSGPTSQPDPVGVTVVRVETAEQMLAGCLAALPVDVAVCAAAVADWKVTRLANHKIKKSEGGPPPGIELAPNPDILATLSQKGPRRPALVIGFAAETENVVANARAKRARKDCDWIVANDVSAATGTFGGDRNTVHVVTADCVEDWPTLAKDAVADRLADRIARHFASAAR